MTVQDEVNQAFGIKKKEAWESYPEGPDGIKVTGTIVSPHPFMIGAKHVAHASEHHAGMLSEFAIECSGRGCEWNGCGKPYKFHETGLKLTFPNLRQAEINKCTRYDELHAGLHAYMLQLKPMLERDGYKGIALVGGR